MPYASLWEALGGLGIFILGMKLMSEGLQKIAGNGIRRFIESLTGTRITSAFLGSCLSASLQSSSAASILVIGFINAGLISLYQALAVMLGTGIGTTLAVQFIAFRVTIIAQPLIFCGTILKFFCHRRRWVYAGDLILGAGLVFLGLQIMESGFIPFAEEAIGAGIREIRFPWQLLSVALGALLSLMLQSGSAAVGVVIALTASGLVKYDHGFLMVIGEVLGTTAIAGIATISGTIVAKRAILLYFFINIVAISLVLIFPRSFQTLVHLITPGSSAATASPQDASISRLLAMSHTLFSGLSIVLFLPLLGFFVRSAKAILPGLDKGVEFEPASTFLDQRVVNTPSLALLQVRSELRRMAEIASTMYDDVVEQFFRFDARRAIKIAKKEESLDILQRHISEFLVKLSRQQLSTEAAVQIPVMLNLVNMLEHIGDQSEVVVNCLTKKKENKVIFSSAALSELKNLAVRVGELLHLALEPQDNAPQSLMADARHLKDDIKAIQETMHANHIRRLSDGQCSVLAGVAYSDIIAAFDKIADYAFTIIKLAQDSQDV